ncbi:GNAT family N-acetyltransferase [Pseudoalteromonas sp. GB56]
MITIINNAEQHIAQHIFEVFQASYKVEARIIGVDQFPPLARTLTDIQRSSSCFIGYFIDKQLAGVIEITLCAGDVEIHSLTVDPEHFKKGIGSKLILHVLQSYAWHTASVETAVANLPAIRLYEKHGFVQCKRWTPAHGIEKVALLIDKET